MFRIFIIIALLIFKLPAAWHSRYNPPRPGQLYMIVTHERDSYLRPTSIVITHYNPDFKTRLPVSGWYDVNKYDIHRWMKKGYKVYIFPRKYRTDKQKPWEWDG